MKGERNREIIARISRPNTLISLIVSRWSSRMRRRSALRQHTHVARWKATIRGSPPWDERNELIAGLIEDAASVLDLGAGAQTLRGYLPSSCFYQPCDLVQRTPDTWPLDFNRDLFPVTDMLFDVVVLSGVIEYARSPAQLLGRASRYGRTILVSYAPMLSESLEDRQDHGWLNHLSKDELETVFASVDLDHELLGTCLDGQLLYRLAG